MKARVLAFYLPQYHPTPENDATWGPGFTEWTNVVKARPQFRGHYQPHYPADLGFYDLRLPETRERQAELAREAGIEGFCYYHYWFGGGRQVLERPFREVQQSGKPDFPFCLCWANHEWSTKSWNKNVKQRIIAEQRYGDIDDYRLHFMTLLPAFRDKRYVTVDGKPIFVIYDPYRFPDITAFMDLWRSLAVENGLPGIHFVGFCNNTTTMRRNAEGHITRCLPNLESSETLYHGMLSLGFDGLVTMGKSRAEMIAEGKWLRIVRSALHSKLPFLPVLRYDYCKVASHFLAPEDSWENIYPTLLSGWDRTPRVGRSDGVYTHFTPEAFADHIRRAVEAVSEKQPDHRLIFLKSWNEWGEGNYVEPDEKYGHAFLKALSDELR